jgi:hypothetical protein
MVLFPFGRCRSSGSDERRVGEDGREGSREEELRF